MSPENGNFGGKPKLYETSKQKTYGRDGWILTRFTEEVQSNVTFLERILMPTKLFRTVKYEGFGPIETTANPRADLSIQERKEFEEKIKLENKLIDTGYNWVLQKVKILR